MLQLQTPPESAAVPLEEGDPAVDPRLFRRCLGQYATGIAVVTAQSGQTLNGMTINSFASLSLEPALVLWSIARTSRSFDFFTQCQSFAINVLSAEQIKLSQHFSSKLEDRFSDIDWQPGQHGSPLLAGCIAHFECTTEQAFEGGDHIILVGRVSRIARFAGTPLLFSQGQYSIADTHPSAAGEPESVGGAPRPETNLLSSIFDAHHALSEAFEEHRRAEGVSLAVARVLASLYARPGIGIEALARETYLGQRDIEDALGELQRKAMLHKDSDGGLRLTAEGERARLAIRERWQAFQKAQLEGTSASELKITLATLDRLLGRQKAASVASA